MRIFVISVRFALTKLYLGNDSRMVILNDVSECSEWVRTNYKDKDGVITNIALGDFV